MPNRPNLIATAAARHAICTILAAPRFARRQQNMPELPEVETMRRGIEPIVGSVIEAVERPRCSRRPIAITPSFATLRRRIVGRRIVAVERAGKRVVMRLEGDDRSAAGDRSDAGDRIVIEPRMTGLVLLADPPTAEHLRLRIHLTSDAGRPAARSSAAKHTSTSGAAPPAASAAALPGAPRQLLFWDRRGLGLVRLLDPAAFARLFGPDKLGPDALELSAAVLAERLATSRRAIKVALLDQKALAGVGNLYASEILHLAGLHPLMRCDKLRSDDWPRLHRALRQVLSAAIRYEGSTLGDGTYRNALNQQGSYQNHHRVYGRGKLACLTCKQETVTRIVQAQRSTFFCRRCQAARKSSLTSASSK
jgi:formamidopyrimidine-DNA glycosylase